MQLNGAEPLEMGMDLFWRGDRGPDNFNRKENEPSEKKKNPVHDSQISLTLKLAPDGRWGWFLFLK